MLIASNTVINTGFVSMSWGHVRRLGKFGTGLLSRVLLSINTFFCYEAEYKNHREVLRYLQDFIAHRLIALPQVHVSHLSSGQVHCDTSLRLSWL